MFITSFLSFQLNIDLFTSIYQFLVLLLWGGAVVRVRWEARGFAEQSGQARFDLPLLFLFFTTAMARYDSVGRHDFPSPNAQTGCWHERKRKRLALGTAIVSKSEEMLPRRTV